jgi:hypothetical protein
MSSGTCAVADKYTAEEILRAAQVSGSAAFMRGVPLGV